jgi:hypothetical protein
LSLNVAVTVNFGELVGAKRAGPSNLIETTYGVVGVGLDGEPHAQTMATRHPNVRARSRIFIPRYFFLLVDESGVIVN